MSIHLDRAMDKLRHRLLEQCARVEQSVRDASRAFLERDGELALQVIAADSVIDRHEVDIEESCLGVLALYQPVASDLRLVFSAVKINNCLERIGDLAVNLAKKARTLSLHPAVPIPEEFAEMSTTAREMLTCCIDAFVESDSHKANMVIRQDDQVDTRKRQVRKHAETAIMNNPADTPRWLTIIAASRNIERIADLTTAVAEDVIYSVEGRIVRHAIDSES